MWPLLLGFIPFNWKTLVNLSIKGSEAQKQRPHELLWMLWFDEKSLSKMHNQQKFIEFVKINLTSCKFFSVYVWCWYFLCCCFLSKQVKMWFIRLLTFSNFDGTHKFPFVCNKRATLYRTDMNQSYIFVGDLKPR